MRTLRCGLALSWRSNTSDFFNLERTLQGRIFRHFSVLNTVIRVRCCPPSNSFSIPQDRSRDSFCSQPPLVFFLPWRHRMTPSRWNSGSEWWIQVSFPVAVCDRKPLCRFSAKCQWRRLSLPLCASVSIRGTYRAQTRPLLCDVKPARSFSGKSTKCS